MRQFTKKASLRSEAESSVKVVAGPQALAQAGAELFVALARQGIETTGSFRVALSGGSTPLAMYDMLSQPPLSSQVDWRNVFVYWGDERFVPQGDPENLFSSARARLLARVPIQQEHTYPWPTENISPEDAARRYADVLQSTFQSSQPKFDLVLLGMGPDGHTASLFPGSQEIAHPTNVLTIPVYGAPKPPPTRLSFTSKLINDAEQVVFLVSGKDKAEALRAVIQGEPDPVRWPSQVVSPVDGHLQWLIDEEAASELSQPLKRTAKRKLWSWIR